MTPLDWAATGTSEECVKMLLPLTPNQSLALHLACLRSTVNVVNLLIDSGHSVDKTADDNRTPAHYAALSGNMSVLCTLPPRLLVQRDEDGRTPLMAAAQNGRLEVIERMCTDSNVHECDDEGWTMLHHAAASGHVAVYQYLAQNMKLQYAAARPSLMTPLMLACKAGHVDTVGYIVNAPGPADSVNKEDINGDTALHLASAGGFVKIAELLLQNGAKLAKINMHSKTAVDVAVLHDHSNVLDFFYEWSGNHPKLPHVFDTLKDNLNRTSKANSSPVLAPSPRHTNTTALLEGEEGQARYVIMLQAMELCTSVFQKLSRTVNRYQRSKISALKTAFDGSRQHARTLKKLAHCSVPLYHIVSACMARRDFFLNMQHRYYNRLFQFAFVYKNRILHKSMREADMMKDVNSKKHTDLQEMIQVGSEKKLLEVFLQFPKIAANDHNVLQAACMYSRHSLVELLLEKGADPNHAGTGAEYPLHICIEVDSLSCLQKLEQHSATNMSILSKTGYDPFAHASLLQRKVILDYLEQSNTLRKKNGAPSYCTRLPENPSPAASTGLNVVHELLMDPDTVEMGVEYLEALPPEEVSALVLHKNDDGRNALFYLLHAEDTELKLFCVLMRKLGLFEKIVLAADKQGNTCLHHLATMSAGELVTIITDECRLVVFEATVDVLGTLASMCNVYGDTAFHLAVSVQNIQFISAIGADPIVMKALNTRNLSPLDEACKSGVHKMYTLLNSQDRPASTSMWDHLLYAVSAGKDEFLAEVYNTKNRPSPRSDGLTALHVACKFGQLACLKFLVQSGEDPQQPATGRQALTAMHFAICGGFHECTEYLLQTTQNSDAYVGNIVDSQFNTPLHTASLFGRRKIVEQLLADKEVLVNPVNKMGNTPLHNAALGWDLDIVRLLIEKGADLNAMGVFDWQPLHCACSRQEFGTLLISGVSIASSVCPQSIQFFDLAGNLVSVDEQLVSQGDMYCYIFERPTVVSVLQFDVLTDELNVLHNGKWLTVEDMHTRVSDTTNMTLYNPIVTELYHAGSVLDDRCLRIAVSYERGMCARQVITLGVSPKVLAHNALHHSVLHEAAVQGNMLICMILISSFGGALMSVFNTEYLTPLHCACRSGNLSCIEYLASESTNIGVCVFFFYPTTEILPKRHKISRKNNFS